jgi:hypothetical protein
MSDPGIKIFEFAAKRKASDAKSKGIVLASFEVDGQSFDIRPLKDSSVAYLVHKISGGSPAEVISAVLNFTEKALTPESSVRFEKLVLDPDAGLELDEVVQIFEHILEVVSNGVPTMPPPASSASRRKTTSSSAATKRAAVESTP